MFEYTVCTYDGENSSSGNVTFPEDRLEEILNEHGKDRWELVHVQTTNNWVRFFFKRAKK